MGVEFIQSTFMKNRVREITAAMTGRAHVELVASLLGRRIGDLVELFSGETFLTPGLLGEFENLTAGGNQRIRATTAAISLAVVTLMALHHRTEVHIVKFTHAQADSRRRFLAEGAQSIFPEADFTGMPHLADAMASEDFFAQLMGLDFIHSRGEAMSELFHDLAADFAGLKIGLEIKGFTDLFFRTIHPQLLTVSPGQFRASFTDKLTMRKEGFFVTLIFLLLVGCSTTPQGRHVSSVHRSLPKTWIAKSNPQHEARCATPRQTSFGAWWSFCEGGAHGTLSIFKEDRTLLSQQVISSTDRLAMAKSVSAQSTWVEWEGLVWVGTQDGRVLGLDAQGHIKKARQFQDNTWFKDIAVLADELVVLSVRYQDVRVLKLDDDLKTTGELVISEARHEAEMSVQAQAIFIATDVGFLVELNRKLELEHLWRLSPGSALGPMTVTAESVWVGNEEGRLYHVQRDSEFVSVKVGQSAITTAPVLTPQGVWVALDEEGVLRVVDQQHKIRHSVQVPMSRTLLSFESVDYQGHTLLGVASNGSYTLLTGDGETLLQIEAHGRSLDYLLSVKNNGKVWLGEWELAPTEKDIDLRTERTPASNSR